MDPGRVEREFTELWRKAAIQDQAVVRACTLNLVVVCSDAADAQRASISVVRLSEAHPGRVLMIAPLGEAGPPSGSTLLDAQVAAHCHRSTGGTHVCCEQVTLEAAPGGLELVPATVLQLLVEDLAVFTWWRRPLDLADPLLLPLARLSDRFVAATGDARDPAGALNALATIKGDLDKTFRASASRLMRATRAAVRKTGRSEREPAVPEQAYGAHRERPVVGDLTWIRLESWRDVIASFFDTGPDREALAKITDVTIRAGGPAADSGLTVPAAYLAGWLTSRLGWKPDREPFVARRRGKGRAIFRFERAADLEPGQVGLVRLEARDAGPPVTFVAERLSPRGREVRLTVERDGTCPLPSVLKLNSVEEHALLCDEIDRESNDPVFETALSTALRLVVADS
jgi:glucose-6-phosphate dehydrogenase assembly protein OpcA